MRQQLGLRARRVYRRTRATLHNFNFSNFTQYSNVCRHVTRSPGQLMLRTHLFIPCAPPLVRDSVLNFIRNLHDGGLSEFTERS